MFHKVVRYFDKLEDRIRGRLSRYPIFYAIIGGTAIVLFWRGVWKTADDIAMIIPPDLAWIDGPITVVTSIIMLLATGLLVASFISDTIIVSGLKRQRKIVEKTELEVREEETEIEKVRRSVEHIEQEIDRIEHHIE